MKKDTKKDSPVAGTKGTTSSINYFSTKNLGYQHNIITTLERAALDNVWNRLNVANMPVASFTLRKRRNLFDYARIVMDEYNILGKSFGNKNFFRDKLSAYQAAHIVSKYEIIRMVCTSETVHQPKSNGILAYYRHDGPNEGVYEEIGDGIIDKWSEELVGSATSNWKNEFYKKIKDIASRHENRIVECEDENLIFMRNCIFNYKTRERMDFSYEYVTLRKFDTDLPPSQPKVPIHTKPNGSRINLLEFLHSLVPYDGGVDFLVKVAGAVLRSKKNWRYMVTLQNTTGKNGKSTFLDMLKAMVGPAGTLSTDIVTLAGANSAGRFALGNMIGVSLITCEDSEQAAYLTDISKLKSIISHDTITIERKFEDAFNYRPKAFIVAAANDLPKTKDKGQAWLDRNIFVPFTNEFRGQDDDKSIREVWVKSEEVRSYMAYQALVVTEYYDELIEPEESKKLKSTYEEENDPIVEFYRECIHEHCVDFLPKKFLWAWYKEWLQESRPSTKPPSERSFFKSLVGVVNKDGEWSEQREDNGKPQRFDVYAWRIGSINSAKLKMYVEPDLHINLSPLETGIVRTKMWDYCRDNNTTPAKLYEDKKYYEVCDDLGLSYPYELDEENKGVEP